MDKAALLLQLHKLTDACQGLVMFHIQFVLLYWQRLVEVWVFCALSACITKWRIMLTIHLTKTERKPSLGCAPRLSTEAKGRFLCRGDTGVPQGFPLCPYGRHDIVQLQRGSKCLRQRLYAVGSGVKTLCTLPHT